MLPEGPGTCGTTGRMGAPMTPPVTGTAPPPSTGRGHHLDFLQSHSQWRPPQRSHSPGGLRSVRNSRPPAVTRYSIPSRCKNLYLPR